jgi:hypothetical protein
MVMVVVGGRTNLNLYYTLPSIVFYLRTLAYLGVCPEQACLSWKDELICYYNEKSVKT